MTKDNTRNRRASTIFLIVFVISSLVAGVLILTSTARGSGGSTSAADEWSMGTIVATLTSCTTALVTLFGFISTTALAWRKEQRESAAAELEQERKRIDLERQRLELGQKKKEDGP
ncbi:MAG: hypothetical protein JW900_04955 [Anaerolineae bacterium]|nr:hypothetical protein [Anaerolineae bacterium]